MRRFALLTIFMLAGTLAFAQAKKVKTKAEGEAVMALQKAQQAGDPDGVIKAADDLLTKFADTDFKAYILGVEADAYEHKGDHAKAIVYGEQALAADPETYDADILLANIYANTTRENDLDKEEKLKKAEKYANDGIAAAGKAPKPNPQLPDDQWEQVRKSEQAQGYQALGTIAMVRKKYDDAMAAYQKGVELDPDPVIMIRAGRAMLTARKPAEAISWFDKAAASPNATAQIKEIAAADKKRAEALPK
jgi:tetratricopeptide (TPR) repeat protein